MDSAEDIVDGTRNIISRGEKLRASAVEDGVRDTIVFVSPLNIISQL